MLITYTSFSNFVFLFFFWMFDFVELVKNPCLVRIHCTDLRFIPRTFRCGQSIVELQTNRCECAGQCQCQLEWWLRKLYFWIFCSCFLLDVFGKFCWIGKKTCLAWGYCTDGGFKQRTFRCGQATRRLSQNEHPWRI